MRTTWRWTAVVLTRRDDVPPSRRSVRDVVARTGRRARPSSHRPSSLGRHMSCRHQHALTILFVAAGSWLLAGADVAPAATAGSGSLDVSPSRSHQGDEVTLSGS